MAGTRGLTAEVINTESCTHTDIYSLFKSQSEQIATRTVPVSFVTHRQEHSPMMLVKNDQPASENNCHLTVSLAIPSYYNLY